MFPYLNLCSFCIRISIFGFISIFRGFSMFSLYTKILLTLFLDDSRVVSVTAVVSVTFAWKGPLGVIDSRPHLNCCY